MRVLRAFAVGLGAGYLIWSGAGRRLVDKAKATQHRLTDDKTSSSRRGTSTEAAVMPVDLIVPTAGAEPVIDQTVTGQNSPLRQPR